MNLVIVESPSKAKTIGKYLGSEYTVIASYGHIRQLKSKANSVLPDDNFSMVWETLTKSKKHVAKMVELIKKSSTLYLATDPDREGEAISWHIYNYLKDKRLLKSVNVKRVVFNSITKAEIQNAFKKPRDLESSLVDAYLARNALDYLVGFSISPILWKKLPGTRSAGRVQSVALRMICEREEEILSFIPIEYWQVDVNLTNSNVEELATSIYSINGEKLEKLSIKNQKEAHALQEKLENSSYTVTNIEEKDTQRNPYAPFTTSTLQQEAFNKLGFNSRHTMQVAQKLYEGINIKGTLSGVITYMRTDATQINPEFIKSMQEYIKKEYGSEYLHSSTRHYKTKAKNAQEAHEAIRPTTLSSPKQLAGYLTTDELKLYTIIWNRSLASQMASVKYKLTTLFFTHNTQNIILKATGSIITFNGFYELYNGADDKNTYLPEINLKDKFESKDVQTHQHFTQPKARYSEATLIKELEEKGIGRPSTYASIIHVLQDREYTYIKQKRFFPYQKGMLLSYFLKEFFLQYVEYNFTSQLEDKLDLISSSELNWKKMLSEFWDPFNNTINNIKATDISEIYSTLVQRLESKFIEPNTKCSKCNNGTLGLKIYKQYTFIGCTNYPDCSYQKYVSLVKSLDELEEDENTEDYIPINTVIGKEPETNEDIILKKGPYGYYLEMQAKKIKRTALGNIITPQELTLEKAIFLINLPKKINSETILGVGPYGTYIKHNNTYVNIKDDIFSLTDSDFQKYIQQAKIKASGVDLGVDKNNNAIVAKIGRYGNYIQYKSANYKLPKGTDILQLTNEQALEIIAQEKKAKKGTNAKKTSK